MSCFGSFFRFDIDALKLRGLVTSFRVRIDGSQFWNS